MGMPSQPGGGVGEHAPAPPPADPASTYASQQQQLQDMIRGYRSESARLVQHRATNAAVERLLFRITSHCFFTFRVFARVLL